MTARKTITDDRGHCREKNRGLEISRDVQMFLQIVASLRIAGNMICSPKASLYSPHCRKSLGETVTPALLEMKSNAHPAQGLAVRVTSKPRFTHNIPDPIESGFTHDLCLNLDQLAKETFRSRVATLTLHSVMEHSEGPMGTVPSRLIFVMKDFQRIRNFLSYKADINWRNHCKTEITLLVLSVFYGQSVEKYIFMD